MKTTLLFLLVALVLPLGRAGAAAASAGEGSPAATTPTPLTRDLGRNLIYYRVRHLPNDLPIVARKQPCVLDLRYLRADEDEAAGLHTWIRSYAAPRTPVFVLANAETSRDLVAPLTGRGATGSIVVIGAAARSFSPDIDVKISAEDERRAYDALESGTELSALLTENPHKVRNDEASLSRDRASASASAQVEADATRNASGVPIDAALQRAVHLHRTLVALRKL